MSLTRTDLIYRLPIVTITDAAVSMVANTRYEGSIAAFTADRNYTLPAGTAGDVIEVAITTGDDAYELILLGASGVSINGGTAATEWSRLFISNEFVRFRCIATNDWRVEVDGRIACLAEVRATATQSIFFATHTTVLVDSIVVDNGNCVSIANDNIVARRAGNYLILAHLSLGNLADQTRFIGSTRKNSVQTSFSTLFSSGTQSLYVQASAMLSMIVNDTFSAQMYWDVSGGSGTKDTVVSAAVNQPKLFFRELL